MKNELNLQSPWITHVNKIMSLFKEDPDIHFNYNEDTFTLTMYVDNNAKAEALHKIIDPVKKFGNITLKINIVPANTNNNDITGILNCAFSGNPHFSRIEKVESGLGIIGGTYCVFKKEVIQFYNDDLTDLYRNYNGLAEDIARDVLNINNASINFCTDVKNIN